MAYYDPYKSIVATNVYCYRYSTSKDEYAIFENCKIIGPLYWDKNDAYAVFGKGKGVKKIQVKIKEGEVRRYAGYYYVWLHELNLDIVKEKVKKAIAQYVKEQTAMHIQEIINLRQKYKDFLDEPVMGIEGLDQLAAYVTN